MLRWFGHVKRMDDEIMVKRVYDSGMKGRRDRGRSIRVWKDGVKEVITEKDLTLEQARVIVHDRPVRRRLINGA